MSILPSSISPEFERYARLLGELSYRETAGYFYEVMSGGVMWDDEKADLPFDELGWFRAILAYRTSVLLGEPRKEFEAIWNAVKEFAPNWPGFRSERCTPSSELMEFLMKSSKKTMRAIDRMDASLSGRWRPLSGKPEKG